MADEIVEMINNGEAKGLDEYGFKVESPSPSKYVSFFFFLRKKQQQHARSVSPQSIYIYDYRSSGSCTHEISIFWLRRCVSGDYENVLQYSWRRQSST